MAACYTFYPKANMPIKVIVLDDTDKMDGSPYGCLDEPRYDWLINELESGQAADELMIICSHIPVWSYEYQSPPTHTFWNPDSYVSDKDLVSTQSAAPIQTSSCGSRDMSTATPSLHRRPIPLLNPAIPIMDRASTKSRPHR